MSKTRGTDLVDKHLVLITCARLYEVVNTRPDASDVVEQDIFALKVFPSDYYYETPLYDTLIADIRASVETFLRAAVANEVLV